ncbi:imidazole glycerol phosphate synthase subunit HisH [Fulvivirgaceae bacterium BMA12]|uniref:Imidazole glycerol phosphate synthase subunit HisH n=1 Tax=Agaribacillus aureus TaxID=3051825 RepID=A0ABT8L7Y6_9BACT|nr:imidazole glycerol phosphate synthase subunit HisH [Fulvivirgaceae bacterium BMA12]
MKVAVIRYNAGNVQSVVYALERLGVTPLWTDDHETIKSADKVIFPGQGEASTAMAYLRERGLDQLIVNLKQPVLGICIGLQLMCGHSEEGDTKCLGIFDLEVRKFVSRQSTTGNTKYKIPHMGWNRLENCEGKIFSGLNNPYVYYVHSFYADKGDDTVGTTDYILPFSGALHKDNFYAVQAHIEKSGTDGQKILTNFLEL